MPCRIYKLDFQEKNSNLDRDLKSKGVWYLLRMYEHTVQIVIDK